MTLSIEECGLVEDIYRFIEETRTPTELAKQPFIHTASGEKFYPAQPSLSTIKIEDIAAALSKICRFNGHCRVFYSVANHACLVHDIVPKKHRLSALCHDNAEGLALGDFPRPIKYAPGMAIYRAYEKRISDAVADRFGIPRGKPEAVQQADNILLCTEQRDLMHGQSPGNIRKPELDNIKPLKKKIKPWSPERSEREFLKRFRALTK